MKRQYVIAAVAAVAAFLLYRWWKNRHYVLDPSNSTSLSNLFDQLNPTIGGSSTVSSDTAAQGVATGTALPPLTSGPQNWFPIGKQVGIGETPPIYSPPPPVLVLQ